MQVGFVGLGAMGMHMARSLHRAGLLTRCWNRTHSKAEQLAAEIGTQAAPGLAELALSCEVVVICVSADADVLDVIAGLSPGLRRGHIVLDCSTVSASTARTVAAQLKRLEVDFLDCPVSGGIEGARDATLTIMVGGDATVLGIVQPVLAAMGRTVTHMGPTGHGQATKATNQIMCAGIIQTVAEAMAFARHQGLPLQGVIEALGNGAGSSWYFVNRAPYMVRGVYPAGFRIKLHQKDLGICREMAASCGVSLSTIETTLQMYGRLVNEGYGDEDISAVFRLKDAAYSRADPAPGGE